jgi:probable DNA repair protein
LNRIPAYIDSVIEAGGTIVTPTRQRAHALRLAYAARELGRGRRVWLSPDVLPLAGWLTRGIERRAQQDHPGARHPRLLTDAEEWLLWREGAAQEHAGLELVNPGALADGLLGASRLAAELGIDVAGLHAAPHTETALLQAVHRAVGVRCGAIGAASRDALLGRGVALGDQRPVAFCGMLEPTPRLRTLIDERRALGWPTEIIAPPAAPPPVAVVRAADETEELDRIAQWCRERLERAPAGRLLVVLPGSMGRRERLAALIRQSLDPGGAYTAAPGAAVGIEGGASLADHPAVSQALFGLRLLTGAGVSLESLLEWLRSTVLRESPADRARLDLWLRERAAPQLERGEFARALAAAPGPAAAALRARLERAGEPLLEPNGTARQWSERFHAALEGLGWPGPPGLDSPSQQTAVRLRELLDEFGQLSAAAGALSGVAALERLRELAVRTAYRPADEDPAVTVTGQLADPVARYEGIWVAGLHAETLPKPPTPDPFLPLAAQLAAGHGGASSAARLREARGLLGAWRAATDHLVLSLPLRAEDVRLLPSPLLAPWLGDEAPQATVLPWLPERVHREDRLEPWRDVGVAWARGAPLPAGTRSLELQNDCPFRAYAELRLGCERSAVVEPGIAADLRGRLLHAALQHLWEALGDSGALCALAPAALEALIGTCVERAAAELIGVERAPPTVPAVQRECRRAARLIAVLCAAERQRAPFTVRYTEHACELVLGEVSVRVRIDRVDALGDGSLAVLDYKSGRAVRPDWYGERPSHPQLLAYLAALGEPVRALATVNLTAREVGFHGIAARDGLLPQVQAVRSAAGGGDPWGERVEAWGAVLERLAGAFARGEAPVDPKPGACDYCHLRALCRIEDEFQPQAPEAPEGM